MKRLFAMLAATLLAGCGLKGPLYLPDRGGEVVTRPTQTPPPAQREPGDSTPQPQDDDKDPDEKKKK